MLLACLMYSYYTLALKTRLQISGIEFFTLMSVIANLLALPLFFIDYIINGINYPSFQGWIITVLVAIFPSSLAQIFYLRAVDIAGPGKAGIYTNIVPIFSSILAVIILNQSFHIFHGISLVLVLTGIWIAEKNSIKFQ
jgi:drug/metabolite transporter (DMT)-like permease